MEQEKLWSRPLIVLMGVNFCSALSFYLIMVKITEYASDTYGVPAYVAGMTFTAYVIAALVARLLFGKRIDQWGVKRSLVIGSTVNAAAMVLYLVPMGFRMLLVVRVIHGFGFAIMSGAAAAGAALVIPTSRYGEGIGYFSMMQALATGVGPFVAILITNIAGGYGPMFAFATFIAVLALVSLAFLDMLPAPTRAGAEKPAEQQRGIASLVQMSIVPLSSMLLLIYFGYSGILSFVTSYASTRGLSDAVSLYFMVYAIVVLVSRPPVGRRVDRKGENSIIYYCLVSLVIGFVLLAFAVNGAVLLASAAFAGFGVGATQSIVQAVIARDTPKDEMGRANSTFFMSMDLGSGIGPVAIGALIPLIGYSACYLVLAGLAACAIVVYYFAHGRNH